MKKIFSFPFSIFILLVFILLVSCDNPLFISATGLYEVTFSVNGGSAIDSYRTNKIKEMPYTSRADYTFAGWHKKSDFSDATVTFPLEIKEDTTLYAKWQQEFTVSFETNGGDEIESYKTGIIPTSPDTSRTNYLFAGWYTKSDFSDDAVNFPYTVTKPTTLYAKWLRTYQVTFETNGGSEIAGFRAAVIESSPETTRDGFSFVAWYKDSAGNVISNNSNFVVIEITVKNNSEPRKFDTSNFHLRAGTKRFETTETTYAKEFEDIGTCISRVKELKRDETVSFIVIYKVDKNIRKGRFVLYYQERGRKA